MENKQLKWCFRIKDGLKKAEPNERLSKSYLEQAKSSLLRAEKDLKDGDLLWATVAMYYAEYYALYSFLQMIGMKCENHTCSILAVNFLLSDNKIKIINQHKDKRIDAQYYMRVDKDEQVAIMLQEAKTFIAMFDELVSNLNEKETDSYRNKLKKIRF